MILLQPIHGTSCISVIEKNKMVGSGCMHGISHLCLMRHKSILQKLLTTSIIFTSICHFLCNRITALWDRMTVLLRNHVFVPMHEFYVNDIQIVLQKFKWIFSKTLCNICCSFACESFGSEGNTKIWLKHKVLSCSPSVSRYWSYG